MLSIPRRVKDPRAPMEIVAEALKNAKNVVIFTGAGISRAAGIPTYEESGLRWTREMVDARGPEYMAFKEKVACAQPTATHLFCAKLHEEGRLKRVYTQNIDGLHERVLPADKVVAVHGNIVRDEIVCYGESYAKELIALLQRDFDNQDHANRPDLCLVLGTRLDVFPFQVFPNLVSKRACPRFFVNTDIACLERSARATREERLNAGQFGLMEALVPFKIGKRFVSRKVDWLTSKSKFAFNQWVISRDCQSFCLDLRDQ